MKFLALWIGGVILYTYYVSMPQDAPWWINLLAGLVIAVAADSLSE